MTSTTKALTLHAIFSWTKITRRYIRLDITLWGLTGDDSYWWLLDSYTSLPELLVTTHQWHTKHCQRLSRYRNPTLGDAIQQCNLTHNHISIYITMFLFTSTNWLSLYLYQLLWVIGINTSISVIVVSLTTWEAHYSPWVIRVMRPQWLEMRYQFIFYYYETKLMVNKQILLN